MDALDKKVRNYQDIDADANLIYIIERVKNDDKLGNAIANIAFYINTLRMNRDSTRYYIEELRDERNHYYLRSKEAEQLLRQENDTTFEWGDL